MAAAAAWLRVLLQCRPFRFTRGIFGGLWFAAEIGLRSSSRDATIAEAGDGVSGLPARVTAVNAGETQCIVWTTEVRPCIAVTRPAMAVKD